MRCHPTVWLLFLLPLCDVSSPQDAAGADDGFHRPDQDISKWERTKQDLLWGFSNMYQPCVREIPGDEYRYKMWFFGWATGIGNQGYPGCDAIFHARSKDLEEWEVYSGEDRWDATMNPDFWVPVIADPIDPRRKSDHIKYPIRNRAICEVVSDDGLNWEIVGFIQPEDDAPATHVPQALVTTVDGQRWLYLFYSTQRGGEPTYDYRYDRIRAMRREIKP